MDPVNRVRCISLWQPWASLMACGAKHLETRSWDTKVRGEIYIHASQTKTPIREMRMAPRWWVEKVERALGVPVEDWLDTLPYGQIIARGHLMETYRSETALAKWPEQLPFGDFKPGRFAHFYHELTAIEPIPWKGKQGFFFASLP